MHPITVALAPAPYHTAYGFLSLIEIQTASVLSTQVPGSPQRASRTFRSNAESLIVGLPPTDPNASSLICLTTLAVFWIGDEAVVDRHHTDPFQWHICVPPCDPNTTTTFIDLPKSCFIPDQPGCVLTHLESKWLCWSNQSSKSL